ncbi:MAG: ABC transporter permease [Planctomyces sp.]|nr:ABC transporter permease [Planctomyces sp.]
MSQLPLRGWSRLLARRDIGILLLIAVTTAVVGFMDSRFISLDVWLGIFIRSAPTMIVACGVMAVILTGEIDISAGSLMALLAAVMGLLISQSKAALSLWIGIPAVLALGTAIGTGTGLLVSYGRVPSLVATLGLMTALRGLTTIVMGGKNIDGLPPALQDAAKRGWFGVPVSVWVASLVVLMTSLLFYRMPLGRRIYAAGSSPASARAAGLHIQRIQVFTFAWAGFLTAVATLVDVPRLPWIESGIGSDLELLVITCVVVGGVSISGGRGDLSSVLAAVVLMTMIRPVLTFLDVGEMGEKWTRAIQGVFILLAVIADQISIRFLWRKSAKVRR